MKCKQCNIKMKPLLYCCVDKFGGINRSSIEDEKGNIVGNLRYCPNCGNVQVQLNTKAR